MKKIITIIALCVLHGQFFSPVSLYAEPGVDDTGLVGHWLFNDGTGTTAIDDSSSGDDGVLVNMEEWDWSTDVPSIGNDVIINTHSLDFDGVDEHVRIDDPNMPTGDFTISAWVKHDSFGGDILMISNGTGSENEIDFYVTGWGNLRLYLDGSIVATGTTVLITDIWYHLSATRNGSDIILYVNGVSDATATNGSVLDFSTCPLYIGLDVDSGCSGGLSDYMDGHIDDVRVYDRALTQAEIYELAGNPMPGGISDDLSLWLRADTGVTTSGVNVTTWIDQSGNGNSASQWVTMNQPDVVTDTINFNPSINFEESDSEFFNISSPGDLPIGSSDRTYFFVIDPDILPALESQRMFNHGAWAAGRHVGFIQTDYTFHISSGWHNVQNGIVNTNPIIHTIDLPVSADSSDWNLYSNGLNTPLSTGWGSVRTINTGSDYARIGQHIGGAWTYYYDGDISEVIIYNEQLSSSERNKVESYLAIKYGITLDQWTATDYTLSDDSVAWDASVVGTTYDNDIAGIAQDDESVLDQTRSKSENSDALLTIEESGGGMDDGESFMWSNNDGSVSGWSTTNSLVGYARFDREWYIEENNGDVGNVTISVTETDLPAVTDDVYLLIDTDGDFSSGASAVIMTESAGVWSTTTNLADGVYFTFAEGGAPTDITLSNAIIFEDDTGTGSEVGIFTTIDTDLPSDTHMYSLACDTPGVDDSFFQISSDELQTIASLDAQLDADANADDDFEICIRTTDALGYTFDKNFTIELKDTGNAGSFTCTSHIGAYDVQPAYDVTTGCTGKGLYLDKPDSNTHFLWECRLANTILGCGALKDTQEESNNINETPEVLQNLEIEYVFYDNSDSNHMVFVEGVSDFSNTDIKIVFSDLDGNTIENILQTNENGGYVWWPVDIADLIDGEIIVSVFLLLNDAITDNRSIEKASTFIDTTEMTPQEDPENPIPENPIIPGAEFRYLFELPNIINVLGISIESYANTCVTNKGRPYYRQCAFGFDLPNFDSFKDNSVCERFIERRDTISEYEYLKTAPRKEVMGIAFKMRRVPFIPHVSYENNFLDVALNNRWEWIESVVETSLAYKLISSKNKNFRPDDNITRSEAYAMLMASVCMYPSDEGDSISQYTTWQEKLHATAYRNKITIREWDVFESERPVLRQELFVVASRLADWAERTGGCNPKPNYCFVNTSSIASEEVSIISEEILIQ